MGYHRAGFDVVGVDISPQPRYPFTFMQDDALAVFDTHYLHHFDVVHASPPCQAYTTMSNRHRGAGGKADDHDELIDAVRVRLVDLGKPYVIENVPGAAKSMRSPFMLHGGMFGLGVYRPRLFESSEPILGVPIAPAPNNPVGVYGKLDGRRLWTRVDGTSQHAASSLEQAREAMGIDWMEWRELAESIPPAYTEWIGAQLITSLEGRS